MAQTKTYPESQQAHTSGHDAEGEQLEKQIWADFKALKLNEIEKKLAPEFQSIHQDGPRNRAGEIELIKKLNLGNYTLNNFKTTHLGDTIIVTYSVVADESIDNRQLSQRPSSRLSVWKKNKNNQWQWVAHANLHAVGKR